MVPGVHQEVPAQPIKDGWMDLETDAPDDTLILLCFPHSLCFPCVWGFWGGRSLLDLCVVNSWSSGVKRPPPPPAGMFVQRWRCFAHIQQEALWVGSVLQDLVPHHSLSGPVSQRLLCQVNRTGPGKQNRAREQT